MRKGGAMFQGNLRYFYETVRAGSIRRAGDSLGVAPSSISRQIAILERQIGTPLFERNRSGLELTHAGSLVADYATSVILDFDTLRSDLDDLRGTRRRVVRIAAVGADDIIPATIAFREKFDTVTFEIDVCPGTRVIQALKRNDCDIASGFCIEPDPDITVLARTPEPIVLAVKDGHPAAAGVSLSLRQLSELALAAPDESFGIRRIVEQAFRSEGLTLKPAVSSNKLEALLAFAAAGAGGAVMPESTVKKHLGLGLKIVRVEDVAFNTSSVDLAVLSKRRLPRVVRLFVEDMIARSARRADQL